MMLKPGTYLQDRYEILSLIATRRFRVWHFA